MGEVNWNLGLPQGNPGDAFNQAYQQGLEQRKKAKAEQAMGRLATNPDDVEALAMLAEADLPAAMQVQSQMQQRKLAGLEQHRGNIVGFAKIARQLQVKDEASYQQALAVARQYGLPVEQAPPNFDPQYVQGVLSIADAFEPPKQENNPASVQEFQFAKQQGFQGTYMDFMEEKRGPIVANNGDGTFTLIPRGMGGAPQGGGNIPPPPPGFVLDNDGGQTAPPSGNFPDPLAPL